MKVTITVEHGDGKPDEAITMDITPQALDDVRYKFNPSGLDKVNTLKTIAATYLSTLEKYAGENPAAAREFAMTRTLFQFVSMGGVLAATKGL